MRENEGVIEAEIFPDLEYASKKKVKDVPARLQEIIDTYNEAAPLYKRVFRLKVRSGSLRRIPRRRLSGSNVFPLRRTK